MNQWINEFRNILDDDKIINFYIEEILSLENKNYETIVNHIGDPRHVANVELKNMNLLSNKLSKNKISKNLLRTYIVLIISIVFFVMATFIITIKSQYDYNQHMKKMYEIQTQIMNKMKNK